MSTHMAARLTVPVSERDHSRGPADAPVTLVEYGDYECPYCGEAYPVLEELQQRLGDRSRFIFRHFPLTQIHPHAYNAAETAETAAAQDSFWEMHDTLFTHQFALDDLHLVEYAASLGLDPRPFYLSLTSHCHAARVREDFVGGIRSGVNGTPSLFINEVRYDGPHDFESLWEAIAPIVAPKRTTGGRRSLKL